MGLVERCVAENARTALDQDEYTERYNGLVSRYETVKTRFDEVATLRCSAKPPLNDLNCIFGFAESYCTFHKFYML